MRKLLLFLLILVSLSASSQYQPTSAKTKFVNGIGIGSKDTSQFTAADTIALTIARDSVMYYRYKGFWRPIATGGNLSAYKLISDTLFANGYTTRARLKQGLDSLAATKGTVNSVGLTMPSAFNVANSPITTSGTLAVTAAGNATQYIRGDGVLANLPTSGEGGGASVSYYLNGSVNQGTIGGVTYYEMNKTPIIGAGTDFTRNSNGYIASFLTDANDPALLNIPAGNWNFETYFQASSGGGSPTFYIELYKYDGTTFTLIASNSGSPKLINDGTNIEAYFSALAVPQTTLTLTDRLAVRIFVTTAGRTITLHTENGHLCQVVTTFTTGLTALNGLTAQVQYFATGTSGTDFNISSATATHTFNLPTASATNRGALSSADWTTFNNKIGAGDTAAMLAPYFRDSDTTGLLSQVVRTFGAQTVFGIKAFGDSMRIGAGLSVLRIQADAGISLSQELNIRKNTNSLSTDFLKIGTSVGSGTLYGSYIKSTSNHLSFTGNDMVLGVTNTSGNNVDAISISSAGVTSINSLSTAGIVTNTSAGVLGTTSIVPIANGGTGSSTQNFVDLTTNQSIGGNKTFSGNIRGGSFIKSGGLSTEFLKADGSVDNNTYTTTSQNALKLNISDTAAMLLGYTRVQRFTDSLTNVQSRIQTKQNILTLTTTGTSGAATLVGATLNIPQYQSVLTNPITGTGTTNYLPKFTGSTTVGNSQVFDNGTNVGIGTATPSYNLDVNGVGRFTLFSTSNPSLRLDYSSTSNYGRHLMNPNGDYVISSPSLNGVTSGNLVLQAGADFRIYTNNAVTNTTAQLSLTPSGNLGLGVTPSAWSATVKALEIGSGGQFIGAYGGTDLWSGTNMYYEGTTFKYKESSRNVTLYSQSSGAHVWLNAPSGTAGNAISFTQAMTLDASGRLGIGTASPSVKLTVSNAANGNIAGFTNTADADLLINLTSGVSLISPSTGILAFGTSSTERMRITSGANLLVGTTTDNGARFQVSGSGTFSSSVTTNGNFVLATAGQRIAFDNNLRYILPVTPADRLRIAQNAFATGIEIGFDNGTSFSPSLTFASTGAATFSSLAGTGTRMVTANSSGQLEATQVVTWNSYTASVGDRINHTCGTTAVFPRYTVVGNIVTVQGTVSVGCITSADTYTEFSIPLPITGSATTGSAIMIGTGTLIDGNGKTANSANYRVVNVDLSAGKAYVNFYPRTNGNSSNVSFFFQYSIN